MSARSMHHAQDMPGVESAAPEIRRNCERCHVAVPVLAKAFHLAEQERALLDIGRGAAHATSSNKTCKGPTQWACSSTTLPGFQQL